MKHETYLKIVVGVASEYQEQVRQALIDAGAGNFGNYTGCSFTTVEGVGRFKPVQGAKPAIGDVGVEGEVREVRIHSYCTEDQLEDVIKQLKAAHPYEEFPLEVYKLEQRPFVKNG